jgi:site-specific DNA-methyltransferase (adenine-specific)
MPESKIYNMDCLAAMRETPDKAFSLAIVDPPYGIDINMNMGRRKGQKKKHADKGWDKSIPDKEYFDELMRVSVSQIVWGGNYFTDHIPVSSHWVYWDKCTPEALSFASGELAWTSFKGAMSCIRMQWSGSHKIEKADRPLQVAPAELRETGRHHTGHTPGIRLFPDSRLRYGFRFYRLRAGR